MLHRLLMFLGFLMIEVDGVEIVDLADLKTYFFYFESFLSAWLIGSEV